MKIYVCIGDVSVEIDDDVAEAHSLDAIDSMLSRVMNAAIQGYHETTAEIITLDEADIEDEL